MKKDIRIIARIKNNHLVKIREEMGLNQVEMAKYLGVSPQHYSRIENLKEDCTRKDGRWKDSVIKICDKLRVLPEDIFPEWFKKITTTRIEKELSAEDCIAISGIKAPIDPLEYLEKLDLSKGITKALSTLRPREEEIIRKRFGFDGEPRTLTQLEDEYKVGKERIRQIESTALRKLRHPYRTKTIKAATEGVLPEKVERGTYGFYRVMKSRPWQELELSTAAENALEKSNIMTMRQLVTSTDSYLASRCKGIGRKTLREIESALSSRGLALGMVDV